MYITFLFVRCETSTKDAQDSSCHSGSLMVNIHHVRRPREYQRCVDALNTTEGQAEQLKSLGLHPEGSAFLELPLVNPYLQVRGDTLHVLDGGVTKRHLEFLGNHLYKMHEDDETTIGGIEGDIYVIFSDTYIMLFAALRLVNKRLRNMIRQDDFLLLSHKLYKTELDPNALRPVQLGTNWRYDR